MIMKFEPKSYKQLCNTRDAAPNGEVQTYYANPDGTRGARKETDKDIADKMRGFWACQQSGAD